MLKLKGAIMNQIEELFDWFEPIYLMFAMVGVAVCFMVYTFLSVANYANFMRGYVGRAYVYRGDTLVVSGYDAETGIFDLGTTRLHANIIYKLKEVTYE